MRIAQSVAENFEDPDMRETFVNISLDLYVLTTRIDWREAPADNASIVFWNSQ